MIPLILFIALGILIAILYEVRERQRQKKALAGETMPDMNAPDDGCCGEHLVCERETLLQTNAEIVYYDDEELDALAGIAPEQYTPEQVDAIQHVFATLQERDVPGWCRSMQLRNIALPLDIREEALFIVRERRHL
jgi:hypothetical protein